MVARARIELATLRFSGYWEGVPRRVTQRHCCTTCGAAQHDKPVATPPFAHIRTPRFQNDMQSTRPRSTPVPSKSCPNVSLIVQGPHCPTIREVAMLEGHWEAKSESWKRPNFPLEVGPTFEFRRLRLRFAC